MDMAPEEWKFVRNEAVPIIEISCESQGEENESEMVEVAIELIEIAKEFGGRPIQKGKEPVSTQKIMVSFSLIFPSQKEITRFFDLLIDSL